MKLRTFFVEFIGAKEVFNLATFNELALKLSYEEFHKRFTESAKMDKEKLKLVKKGIKWN